VGWQDRDWAKWTDAERARFVGAGRPTTIGSDPRTTVGRRSEVTLLAMLVSLAGSWGVAHFHLLDAVRPAPVPAPPSRAVVYGTGLAHLDGRGTTCTAMAADSLGAQHCTTWTLLAPGQRALQAEPLPAGTACSAVEADQESGRWVCTSRAAPVQSSRT
jgi:hypothetical protein